MNEILKVPCDKIAYWKRLTFKTDRVKRILKSFSQPRRREDVAEHTDAGSPEKGRDS